MKYPTTLKAEAADEAYKYFDKNIRSLPKLNKKIDLTAPGLEDNDVDAFRHAYVSGVFTQEYSESTADIFGQLNELQPWDFYSNSNNPRAKNMDLWNNAVGRKYGKKSKSRKDLLKKIHQALKKGELIINPDDPRNYKGKKLTKKALSKTIIVLREDKNGRNKIFYDTKKQIIMKKDEFIAQIQAGSYPDYTIKSINGKPTPVSNRDSSRSNNLG